MKQTRLPTEESGHEEDLPVVLESLYVINKHAKKYAEQGTQNYHEGNKTTAKANSNKKKALYTLKEKVIVEIKDRADKIEIHEIDGKQYYCLFFPRYSFHTPIDHLEIEDERIQDSRRLEDFEKESDKEKTNKSLKDSLLHLEAVYGFNANDYLPRKKLWYGSKSYFIGWDYLGQKTTPNGGENHE